MTRWCADSRFATIVRGLLRAILVVALFATVGSLAVVSYDYVDPTVTGREYYARIVLACLIGPALFCLARIRRIEFSTADLLVLLFGGYVLFNYWLHDGMRFGEVENLLLAFLFYLVFRVFLAYWPDFRRWMLLALLVSGLYEGGLGLVQLYGGAASHHTLYRLTGTFFNPGPYAGYLAAVAGMAWVVVLRSYRTVRFVRGAGWSETLRRNLTLRNLTFGVGCGVLLLGVLLLPVSMSRAAWLSLLVVGGTAAIVETGAGQRIREFFKRRRRLLLPAFVVGLLLTSGAVVCVYGLKRGSADGRLLIWRVSGRVIAQHPWTGVGVGNFGPAYVEEQARYLAERDPASAQVQRAGLPDYAFNEYLHLGVELGVIGLGLFLVILVTTFRNRQAEGREFLYGGSGVLLFALASYPFHIFPTLLLFVLCLAGAQGGRKGWNGRWATGLVLVFTTLGLAARWPVWRAEREAQREWTRLRRFYRLEAYESIAEEYARLYDRLSHEARFVYEYGYVLNRVGQWEESSEVLSRGICLSGGPMFYNIRGNNYRATGRYDCAEADYRHAYALLPGRMYSLYLLAGLYIERGDTVRGREVARSILEFQPRIPSPATADMKTKARRLLEQTTDETK